MKTKLVIESKDIQFIRDALRARGFILTATGWFRGAEAAIIDYSKGVWFTVVSQLAP